MKPKAAAKPARRRIEVTGTLGILERGAARGLFDLPSTLARLLA
jgi:hypothetical protein